MDLLGNNPIVWINCVPSTANGLDGDIGDNAQRVAAVELKFENVIVPTRKMEVNPVLMVNLSINEIAEKLLVRSMENGRNGLIGLLVP